VEQEKQRKEQAIANTTGIRVLKAHRRCSSGAPHETRFAIRLDADVPAPE
jgi:hypothetical protein